MRKEKLDIKNVCHRELSGKNVKPEKCVRRESNPEPRSLKASTLTHFRSPVGRGLKGQHPL